MIKGESGGKLTLKGHKDQRTYGKFQSSAIATT